MRKVKYRNMRFHHEYNLLPFKNAMSKIIGNSLKQQALNDRMARKDFKFTKMII